MAVPVGDGSFRVDGDDGSIKGVLIGHYEVLDLAARHHCLHLSADVQHIVFYVFEHVDLRHDKFADAVGLLGQSAHLYLLEGVQNWSDGLVVAFGKGVEGLQGLHVS